MIIYKTLESFLSDVTKYLSQKTVNNFTTTSSDARTRTKIHYTNNKGQILFARYSDNRGGAIALSSTNINHQIQN